MNYKNNAKILLAAALLAMPFIVSAATTFEDPLGGSLSISGFISNIITFILSLLGLIGLLGIVYGGVMIVLGGMKSEQDLNRGKQIIFWSILGLVIVGMGAVILTVIHNILGF